jgi:hypothetical protein
MSHGEKSPRKIFPGDVIHKEPYRGLKGQVGENLTRGRGVRKNSQGTEIRN